MKYRVEYTPQAVEALKKLSPEAANLLYSWAEKNLNNCEDPRAQGKGKKQGGRWRYKVGSYRLVCEIEGDKIIILAVTSGTEEIAPVSHDRRGRVKRRTPSVFLKSTTRQPVKVAALLVVTALLTFAFVSRSAEYLLIDQEIDRLGGFYRSTGGIYEPTAKYPEVENKDTTEAIQYLEESPYVEHVNVRQSISAVVPDMPRIGSGPHDGDVFFYGTLTNIAHIQNSSGGHLEGDYRFNFQVDEVLVGTDLGTLNEESTFMIREGASIVLINPQDYNATEYHFLDNGQRVIDAKNVPMLEYTDLTELAETMEVGQRYFLRASLTGNAGTVPGQYTYFNGEWDLKVPALQFKPLTEDGPWYLPVAEGEEVDFNDPRLAGITEEMRFYDDNQHACRIYLTDDMEMTATAWQKMQAHLIDGRWITPEDVAQKRPVCMVYGKGDESDQFHVGDTITMTLRDLSSDGYWAECYTISSTLSSGYIYGGLYRADDLARRQEIEDTAVTIEYEVVGVYGNVEELLYVPGACSIHIPSTLVPESFTHYQGPVSAYDISFALTGPEVQEAFLEEGAGVLANLGFQIDLPDNGWENFQTATIPVKQSSLYNAIVFAAVMAAGLAIVALIYFYMRRRELPIARAIGVPAKTCVRQVMTPILLLAGIPGIALGSVYGWLCTAKNAGDTLSALSEFGQIDPQALPLTYLAAMAGIAFILLLVMVLFGAVLMVRRPILELLQGAARAAVAEVGTGSAKSAPVSAPASVPEVSTLTFVRPEASRKEKLGIRAGLVARFVWRQAARARLKTALTILLAAGFTIGLAAIQLAIASSQERIDWLIENTPVEAELVRTGNYRGASIRRDTVEALQETGYISDFYLEASVNTNSGTIPYTEDWNAGGIYIDQESVNACGILAFEDERQFLSSYGSGASVTITYHDGWNGGMFSGEYTGRYDAETDVRFPVIVPKALYDQYQLEPGSSILLFARTVRPFEVAGYYEGIVSGDGAGGVLLPLSAAQTLCGGRISYSKAHVTLDPSQNREIDRLEAALEEIASRQGIATLRAVIWDEELKQAVAPLEGGIRLMRVLYPVTLVLSILCAAGISVLFIMTSAKEAAILRIQGTTRLRTQVMMGLQQTLTCFVGLIVGLVSVLLYVGSARPELLAGIAASSALCALAYLIAATIGAVASSAVVTSKNPLELLQVKE